MERQIHQGLETYKKEKDNKNYLSRKEFGALTFGPYTEVTLTPSDDANGETISDHPSTGNYNERYESSMDYDNNTVSSMGSSVLSTDGSVYIGQCFAPPGKLAIAIDTVNGQPVVHRVREESPLAGVLRRLDIIVAVDEEDTSSMSAADVTTLMAKKMDKRRKITFMRGKKAVHSLTVTTDIA